MNKVKIESIVRSGYINQIEKAGDVANYEIIEVSSQDIVSKSENAIKLENKLKELLLSLVDKYNSIPFDESDVLNKQKLDLLVDIEEVIKTIARVRNVSWQDLWERAKISTMITFKKYSRIGEPTLKGCVEEFLAFNNISDLSYVEMALFEELKKFNSNFGVFYLKFQDKRTAKKKAQGGYREGYYLKSIEHTAEHQQDLKQ